MKQSHVLFLVLIVSVISSFNSRAQEAESKTYHFDGQISVTNNGFSLIPTFSLGEPAAIAELSVGGERFSFDPQFRFDLNGLRPWSFIFIWRYKVVDNDKFFFRLGAHLPAIAFTQRSYLANGTPVDGLVPRRFITPEVTASYKFTEDISVGLYYLFGIGLEKVDQTRYTHFIALNADFSRIDIARDIYLKFNPQMYYLTLDGTDGIYASGALQLLHDKFPLSIGSMMNVEIDSNIETDKFQWNVSLIYTFENEFVKKRN